MGVDPQVANSLLQETIMGCEWVLQVAMVHPAVVIPVAMDVRTTFHPVIQASIRSSSTVAGIMAHQVQRVQEPVSSLLKVWAHPVLRVRDPPIILRDRHILQCHKGCRNKWSNLEVIQGLIVITDLQTTMDLRGNHRACNLRQTQVILLSLIRTLHRLHHRTDIRLTVSAYMSVSEFDKD